MLLVLSWEALAVRYSYGGNWTDFAIGVGILLASILLFIFRRVVQDGEKIHFREETPAMPEEQRAKRYASWQKAVERALDWEPHA